MNKKSSSLDYRRDRIFLARTNIEEVDRLDFEVDRVLRDRVKKLNINLFLIENIIILLLIFSSTLYRFIYNFSSIIIY